MRRHRILAAMLILLALAACAKETVELPEPADWYEEICQAVELPEMVDVAGELLEANTGIKPEWYDQAVYYIPAQSVAPDEIIIIRAADGASAGEIEEKLRSYLDYREQAAQIYLTENMPTIQAGVIRQDGATVSLIISEQVSQIQKVYERYG